jgi:uncharacterized protein
MENNILSEAIQVDRIHFLKRSDKVLVIDRITGRWVMFPQEIELLLPLVGTDTQFISEPKIAKNVLDLTKILQERGIGIDAPFHNETLNTVILKLTKACNLACTYCYDFEHEDKARHMDKQIALDTIYQSIDLCVGKINFILHGGEPMLVWDLIEELVIAARNYAALKGIVVNFIGQTNLTRIDDKKIQFSLDHDIRWGVSFDGMAALHDKYRIKHNGQGSYDTMIEIIHKYPNFISHTNALSTITSVNQQYLLEIAIHTQELGFAGWDWTLFQAIGRGRNATEFDIKIDSLIHAWDQLFDKVLLGEFEGFAINPILKYLNNFLEGPADNMCMRSKCGAGRDLLSVAFDGTIEACDCIDPCGPMSNLGNMKTDGLLSARNSEKANHIRSREVETLQCGSCMWQAVCGGTCMARAGGVEEISEHECLLSMHIFDRISSSIATSDVLIKYKKSCD